MIFNEELLNSLINGKEEFKEFYKKHVLMNLREEVTNYIINSESHKNLITEIDRLSKEGLKEKINSIAYSEYKTNRENNEHKITDFEDILLAGALDDIFSKLYNEWDHMFDKIKSYVREHGYFPYSDEEARWLENQRKMKSELDQVKVNKLESIEFDWNKLDFNFKNKLGRLKEFIKDNKGQYPNQKSDDPREKELYTFIRRVRKNYMDGKLKKEHHDLLKKELNFKFHRDEQWIDKFIEAKEWIDKNGRFPKASSKDGIELRIYGWLKNQMESYCTTTFSRVRKVKLKEINYRGFVNTIKENKRKKKNTNEEFINSLEKYYRENGKLPLYKRGEPSTLPGYLTKLRKAFKENKLTEDEINRLKKMNFKFDIEVIVEENFDKRLGEFKEFLITNPNRMPNINKVEERQLAIWFNNMKKMNKDGRLSEKKIKRIEYCGVDLGDSRARRWQENYEKAKGQIKRSPNKAISSFIDGKVNPTYTWVVNQRRALKDNKLSKGQIKKLIEIGIEN